MHSNIEYGYMNFTTSSKNLTQSCLVNRQERQGNVQSREATQNGPAMKRTVNVKKQETDRHVV